MNFQENDLSTENMTATVGWFSFFFPFVLFTFSIYKSTNVVKIFQIAYMHTVHTETLYTNEFLRERLEFFRPFLLLLKQH